MLRLAINGLQKADATWDFPSSRFALDVEPSVVAARNARSFQPFDV